MTATMVVSSNTWLGTNAERVAATVTTFKSGVKWFETDTAASYILSGDAGTWVSYPITSSTISTVNTKLGTITNTGGTASVGAILGDFAGSDLITKLSSILAFGTCAKVTTNPVASGNLFTVAGGAVRLVSIIGAITTVVETKANSAKLTFTPSGGAAVDLCGTLNITASAVRKCFYITGTKADALALSADTGVVIAPLASALVLTPGVLALNCTASSTGVVDWYVHYQPMATGATIS